MARSVISHKKAHVLFHLSPAVTDGYRRSGCVLKAFHTGFHGHNHFTSALVTWKRNRKRKDQPLKTQYEADRSISQILQTGVTSSQGTAGGPVRQSPSEQAHTPHLEHEALKVIIAYCIMPFRRFTDTAIQALQKGKYQYMDRSNMPSWTIWRKLLS